MRFVVGIQPEQVSGQFNYDGYYAGISSEFVADDLSVIVNSQAFAEDVNRHLQEMGSPVQIPPGRISGLTFADKQHRILQVTITWKNEAELRDIGQAILLTIEEDSPRYLTQLGALGGLITVIDRPLNPTRVPLSLTQQLDLPVRLILAFIAGVGLVFLLHYLDTSVRNAEELEALGIVVLAEIPRHKGLKRKS
jgi:capsular polysaccharide biosynthesis protein